MSRFVLANRGRLVFQANVGRVRQGVLLPPAALLALSRQGHQPLALGWVYLVELADSTDVALKRARSPRLQPTELRRRKQEAFCGFFKAESSAKTKLAQQEA